MHTLHIQHTRCNGERKETIRPPSIEVTSFPLADVVYNSSLDDAELLYTTYTSE